MPSRRPWWKAYNRMVGDPKLTSLSDGDHRLYIGLLCLASENKRRGVVEYDRGIPLTAAQIAEQVKVRAFRQGGILEPDAEVRAALGRLEKACLIRLRSRAGHADPVILIRNWRSLQEGKPSDRPEATKQRKRKSRKAKKGDQSRPMSRPPSRDPVTRSHAGEVDVEGEVYKEPPLTPPVQAIQSGRDDPPLAATEFFVVGERQVAAWAEKYPGVDVLVELDKAAAWLRARPRRKVKSYRQFLRNWLDKAQEDAQARARARTELRPTANGPRGGPPQTIGEVLPRVAPAPGAAATAALIEARREGRA